MSCLRMLLQHLLQRGDQRRIFGIVDAVEHRLEGVMHGRPGAAELGAAFVGQEHLAHAAVGLALLAPHQALRLQRVERAAHRRLLDHGVDREVVDGDAVHDRQHGQRAHLRDGQALLAQILAQRGVVAAHDAVHQIGRELLQPDLAEGRDALRAFRATFWSITASAPAGSRSRRRGPRPDGSRRRCGRGP